MAKRLVIADSSTLIGLAAAGEFQLLRLLFGAVVITTMVRDEVMAAPSLPGSSDVAQAQADGWLTIVDARQIGDSLAALGAGEASVIALALEQDGPCLIALDDAAARARAEDHRLSVIGVRRPSRAGSPTAGTS